MTRLVRACFHRIMRTLALVVTLAWAGSAFPAIIDVPAGDVAALVTAINTANGNGQDDTITLAAGSTYSVTAVDNGVTGLPVVTTKILVQGNGATVQRTGVPEFRLFDVAGTGDLTLDQLTVKGGQVTSASSPNDGGAGIRVLGAGKLTLTGSTVTQNTCLGPACQGGGIILYDDAFPTVTLIDSVISQNSAQQGGGVCLRHNDQIIVITRTTFSGNTGNEGGGLATMGTDTVTITDSTFVGNSVTDAIAPGGALGGGALDVGGGTWTISGSTFTGNSASGNNPNAFATNIYGGGLGENGGAEITIVNSTFTGNSLTNSGAGLVGGAGLFSEGGGAWTLNNVTIAGNTITGSNGSGGGMEATRGIFTVRNSIVHGNTASRNPDCSALGANGGNPVFDSFVLTQGHNVVGSIQGCAGFVATTGDLVGTDPQLGPLADNGGPTQTMALPADSPAVNAGDPGPTGEGTGCEPVDQRAAARPQGGGCDIGAFELGEVAPTTTTSTTLPGNCIPREATFVNIDCRLDLLVAAVQAADDLGRLKPGLVGAITKARDKKIQAETHDAADRAKQAKNALKKAVARTRSFIHKVRSRSARKIIPAATAAAFIDAANPILADMKELLRTL